MSLDGTDEWELPIVAFEILEIRFSGRLSIVAYGDNNGAFTEADTTVISFGGKFDLSSADGSGIRLDGSEHWNTLIPLLALRHARLMSAWANSEGKLELAFDDGSVIKTGRDPGRTYENWEVSGPGRLMLVCPPSGGDPRIAF